MRATNYLLFLPALALLPIAIGLRSSDSTSAALTNPSSNTAQWVGATVPSARVELGCEQAGAIAEMPVREGDIVAAGATLFQLTTRVQELEVQRLKLLADSQTDIQTAKAELAYAEQEEKRAEELHGKGMKGEAELEARRLDAVVKRIAVTQAIQDHDAAVLRWQKEQAKLDERTVKSPMPAYVAKVLRQRGATVDKLEPVVELVRLAPLHVEFDCPIEDADAVRVGRTLQVVRDGHTADSRAARVVHASRSVNAASQTFRVRLELPNQKQPWPSGVKVWIQGAAPKPDGK